MSSSKDTLWTFILGGLVGAAIGVLYAPKSGKETRRSLKKFSEEIIDTVSDLSDNEHKIYEDKSGKDKIGKVFEAGKKAFEEYRKKD
ncbi:MAG: YtxH domain-containing protein [Endomicrobium sp.]|jgi:gas vesicle protein|nr:YtxH domain-containing protein [Endomicrobium sp.]